MFIFLHKFYKIVTYFGLYRGEVVFPFRFLRKSNEK